MKINVCPYITQSKQTGQIFLLNVEKFRPNGKILPNHPLHFFAAENLTSKSGPCLLRVNKQKSTLSSPTSHGHGVFKTALETEDSGFESREGSGRYCEQGIIYPKSTSNEYIPQFLKRHAMKHLQINCWVLWNQKNHANNEVKVNRNLIRSR